VASDLESAVIVDFPLRGAGWVAEVLRNGAWERVENGIPRSTDRIRRLV